MIPYEGKEFSAEEMKQRSQTFLAFMQQRRSLREFSDRPVSKDVIRDIIMAASTAPSGAHKQPWTFCAISNVELKGEIREAAEKEEYLNYHGRMSDTWLEDLEPMGTDWNKAFLEIAPWLIEFYHLAKGSTEIHIRFNAQLEDLLVRISLEIDYHDQDICNVQWNPDTRHSEGYWSVQSRFSLNRVKWASVGTPYERALRVTYFSWDVMPFKDIQVWNRFQQRVY